MASVTNLHPVRRWRSADGITVRAVRLSHTTHHQDGDWLFLTWPNGIVIGELRRFPGDLAWLAKEALGPLTEVT